MPSLEQLGAYYSKYGYDERGPATAGRGSKSPDLRKMFHFFTGDIDPRDFIRPLQGQKVLDFGCGAATYLQDFAARGVNITGAEISLEMVQECRAIHLNVQHVPNPERVPFEDSQFDIVYLMQVFEHLRNPSQLIAELVRVTKHGGTIYVAVPNHKSIWRRLFRKNWVAGWFPPFHLYHYDLESLSKLTAANGAVVVSHKTRTPESWFRLNVAAALSNRGELDRRRKNSSPLLRALLGGVIGLIEYIGGEGDCLLVQLRVRK